MNKINDALIALGLSENCTREEIKNAYRVYAKKFHPDVAAGGDPVKFREVTDAKNFLLDNFDQIKQYRTQNRSSNEYEVLLDMLLKKWQADMFIREKIYQIERRKNVMNISKACVLLFWLLLNSIGTHSFKYFAITSICCLSFFYSVPKIVEHYYIKNQHA